MPEDEEIRKAFNIAYRALARRDFSSGELKNRLRDRGITPAVVVSVIDRLMDMGYLNDGDFARGLVRHCQNIRRLGPLRIKQELAKKGIHGDLQDEALGEYSEKLEEENIRYLTEKKIESGAAREKTARFLQGKGYPLPLIFEYLNEFYPD